MRNIGGYIIYHPPRKKFFLNGVNIYCDDISHNQDPYIWNKQFLHSTCHMTELTEIQKSMDFSNRFFVIFWVSVGEKTTFKSLLEDFSVLYCDLVFVIQSKIEWKENTLNDISLSNSVIDSMDAYYDHYFWVPIDHPYKTKNYGRFTLKSDSEKSFQPQNNEGKLINILDLIIKVMKISPLDLKNKIRKGSSGISRSMPIALTKFEALSLYKGIKAITDKEIKGETFENIRRDNRYLGSPPFGYKRYCKTIEIRSKGHEAEHIKLAFNNFLKNKSLLKTLEELIEVNQKYSKLTINSLKGILSNEMYKGDIIQSDIFMEVNKLMKDQNLI